MIGQRARQLLARRALQQTRQQIRNDHGGSPYTYNLRGSVSIVWLSRCSFCTVRWSNVQLAKFIKLKRCPSTWSLRLTNLCPLFFASIVDHHRPLLSIFSQHKRHPQNLPFNTEKPRLLFVKILIFCAIPYWIPFAVVRHQVSTGSLAFHWAARELPRLIRASFETDSVFFWKLPNYQRFPKLQFQNLSKLLTKIHPSPQSSSRRVPASTTNRPIAADESNDRTGCSDGCICINLYRTRFHLYTWRCSETIKRKLCEIWVAIASWPRNRHSQSDRVEFKTFEPGRPSWVLELFKSKVSTVSRWNT